MTTTLRRPEPTPSRAAQRKQRLLELENEQRLEDAEALKFTEEQRLSLFHSFRSVKFEWCDLDGMRSVRRRYNSSCPASPPPRSPTTQTHPRLSPAHLSPQARPARPPALPLPVQGQWDAVPVPAPTPTPTPAAFAVLTNAHLASFGKDDTICVRSHVGVAFPGIARSFSSPSASPVSPPRSAPSPSPPSIARAASSPSSPSPAAATTTTSYSSPRRTPPAYPSPKVAKASKASPRSGKRRSPVKGLFSPSAASTQTYISVTPIRVPLPPLSSVEHGAEEDDEDAWVDEEGEGDATFVASAEDDESALPTAVPRIITHAEGWGFPPTYDGEEEEEPGTPTPHYEREATPTPYDCPAYVREATPTPWMRDADAEAAADAEREQQVGGKRKR